MPGHSSNYTHYDGRYKKPRNLQFRPDQYSVEHQVEHCSKAGEWSTVPKPYTYRVVENGQGNKGGQSSNGSAGTVTEEQLFSTIQKFHDSRNMRSSKGDKAGTGRCTQRARSARSCVWHSDPHKVYGSQSPVKHDRLENMVQRLTRPTIASRGGVDLAHKKFIYIPPPQCKTFIIIPGLETRFMGRQIGRESLDTIVDRLTRKTHAMNARFAMDPHSWYDNSGWADRHRARTAMGFRS